VASSPDLYRGHRRPVGSVASTVRTVSIRDRGPPVWSVANTSGHVAILYSVTRRDAPSDMTAAACTSPRRVVPVSECSAASGLAAATQYPSGVLRTCR